MSEAGALGFGGTIALVFVLIGLGYALAWGRVLREGTGEALGDFVITVAVPVLLFRTIAGADFADTRPFGLWGVYFTAVLATWIAGTLTARKVFGRDAAAGAVAGLSASFSNLVLLGIPMTLAVFGQPGIEVLSLLLTIHLPILTAAVIVLHELARRRADEAKGGAFELRAVLAHLARTLMRNPIVIGILSGLAWRALPLEMPLLAAETIDRLAAVAGTLALVSLGMSLRRFGIARNVPQGAAMAALKLVLMPAVATLAALLIMPPPFVAKVAIVLAAMPTGVNPYLMAGKLGTGEAMASNTMVLGTAASTVSLLVWITVANALF